MLGFAAIALIAFVLIVPRESEAEEADTDPEASEWVEEAEVVEESGGFFASIGAKLAPLFDDTAKQKSEELDDREHAVLAREVEMSEVKLALIEEQLAHEQRVNALISCVSTYAGGDPT